MLFSDPSGEIRKEAPHVSFLDHGFLFGDSLYEVVRTYDRRILGWKEHMERLSKGGQRLGIDINALLSELQSRGTAILKALDKPNAALRLVISRGIGKLHIDPRTCQKPLIYMAAWELDLPSLQRPISLWVPELKRNSRQSLDPAIKSGNYLNSVMAFQDATLNDCDDAVLLNAENFVTELTTSNIGWIKGGKVFTPHTDIGILHGITRSILLKATEVEEGSYTLQDLLGADEVFALSTFKEVTPVTSIKTKETGRVEFTQQDQTLKLQNKVHELIRKKLSDESLVY